VVNVDVQERECGPLVAEPRRGTDTDGDLDSVLGA
jgi:hypothetical protein